MTRLYANFCLRLGLLLLGTLFHVNTSAIDFGDPGDENLMPGDKNFIEGEFAFVRLQYNNRSGSGWRFDAWATDFPAADANFLRGVSRLTNVRVRSEPIVLTLEDDEVFNYPFLYALEMGRGGGVFFSEREQATLREYLMRGGFLFVDDFWGSYQWEVVRAAISEIFPDRKFIELKGDHEIYHTFFDIDGPQMIPAIGNTNNVPEQDVDYPANFALLDDDGRIMILINWNSDIGDGWEHTYHRGYPTRYANQAYQLGINFLIYSLTH